MMAAMAGKPPMARPNQSASISTNNQHRTDPTIPSSNSTQRSVNNCSTTMVRLFDITTIISFSLCHLITYSTASLFGVAMTRPSIALQSHQATENAVQQLRGGNETPMYRPYLPHTLSIRDSLMIAHSFHNHPSFGPAGGMHGATYTVDVEFASSKLHSECNWVIDIGIASDLVGDVLKEYNYKNLDEVFGDGVMTTTEFMCRVIFEGVVKKLKEKSQASPDEEMFEGWIKVTLWESHKAWGSFEGPLV